MIFLEHTRRGGVSGPTRPLIATHEGLHQDVRLVGPILEDVLLAPAVPYPFAR